VSSRVPGKFAKVQPCTLQFTDGPVDSAFYPFMHCHARRGIILEYQCGGAGEPCDQDNNPYFRPNVNVMRGQIVKIVSRAFFPSCETP
jgi:hypothetical protein